MNEIESLNQLSTITNSIIPTLEEAELVSVHQNILFITEMIFSSKKTVQQQGQLLKKIILSNVTILGFLFFKKLNHY